MREVLLCADANSPATVSQRAYDAARATAGHPTSPRADRLVARFGVSWAVLRERVANHADPQLAVSHAAKEQTRRVLTAPEVRSALRAVAARLGTDELSPEDYERTREVLNAERARRHHHGAHLVPLPSIHTIRQKMSFPEAVEAAGLRVKGQTIRGFMPRTEAVRLFVEHCGFVPCTEDLRFFATRQRFQMVDRGRRLHSEILAEVATAFEAEGKPWPERVRGTPPPEGWKEAAALATSPALDAARAAYPARKTEAYTLEEVTDAIRSAFDLCPPGEKLTQLRYTTIAKAHRLPQPSSVQRVAKKHGTTYGKLVRQVARERAQAAKTS